MFPNHCELEGGAWFSREILKNIIIQRMSYKNNLKEALQDNDN